ncbi:MAG TPA: DUF2589 domain-containing protein [Acidimicrobiia bacterium]
MAIQRMEALQLGELLGSLLSSVVEAQEQSARATVDFVDEVGFEDTAAGRQMRTVTLRYTKRDEDDQPATFEVVVPLLSMVNIPSLAVKEAKLSFSYDVVTSEAGDTRASGSSTTAAPLKPALLKGYVKRRTDTTATEKRTTSIDVDVTLEQQAMPIGVERLFDLAELGITERPAPP